MAADYLYECGSQMELIVSESSDLSDFSGNSCRMTLVGIRANSLVWVFGHPGDNDDDLDFGGQGYVEDAAAFIEGIWSSFAPESRGYLQKVSVSPEELERLPNRMRLISRIANRAYKRSRATFSYRDQFANILPSEILRSITKSKRATDGKHWVWIHPRLYLLENRDLRAGLLNGWKFWNEPLIEAFRTIQIRTHSIDIADLPESINLFERTQLGVQKAHLAELLGKRREVSLGAREIENQLAELKHVVEELDSKISEQTQTLEAGIRQAMRENQPPA